MDDPRKLAILEGRIERLERQLEELIRYLRRVEDDDVQRAARRAQNA